MVDYKIFGSLLGSKVFNEYFREWSTSRTASQRIYGKQIKKNSGSVFRWYEVIEKQGYLESSKLNEKYYKRVKYGHKLAESSYPITHYRATIKPFLEYAKKVVSFTEQEVKLLSLIFEDSKLREAVCKNENFIESIKNVLLEVVALNNNLDLHTVRITLDSGKFDIFWNLLVKIGGKDGVINKELMGQIADVLLTKLPYSLLIKLVRVCTTPQIGIWFMNMLQNDFFDIVNDYPPKVAERLFEEFDEYTKTYINTSERFDENQKKVYNMVTELLSESTNKMLSDFKSSREFQRST